MKVKIKPTQDPEQLRENLSTHLNQVQIVDGEIEAAVEDEESEKKIGLIDRTPGVESYTVDGETFEGLKGRPVQEKMYARLEDDEAVAEALLATIEGYDLIVLEGGLDWELKLLRRFNPDIKQLSTGRSDVFDVEKSLLDEGPEEKVEYDLSEEEVEMLLRFMQPKSLERGEN